MATLKSKTAVPIALGVSILAFVTVVRVADATHPRPKGATPVRVSLALAYKQCTSPNRMHRGPLAGPSCNPPEQASDFLTVGTLDANGAEANSRGFVRLEVRPATLDNVIISGTISDVRCQSAATTTCGSANATGGPDYTGELLANTTIRITDHYNAVDPGGGTDPATVVDVPQPINLYCMSTADTSIGSDCSVPPPYCPFPAPQGCGPRDGDRSLAEIRQIQVFDGGADGIASTQDNTLFMNQGLFVP